MLNKSPYKRLLNKSSLTALGAICLLILSFVLLSKDESLSYTQESSSPLDAADDAHYIQIAKEFVDLIGTYRSEWVEERFDRAKELLSIAAYSEFEERIVSSQLPEIKRTRRAQMFFISPSLIRTEYIPGRERLMVYIPGIRQAIIRNKPRASERLVFEIELGQTRRKRTKQRRILITDFRYYVLEDKEDAAIDFSRTRDKVQILEESFELDQIPDEEFIAIGAELIRLISNYHPLSAKRQFLAAKELMHESIHTWLEEELLNTELAAIKRKRRSQVFFIIPEATNISRFPEKKRVEVILPGIQQRFWRKKALRPNNVKYILEMTTISGKVRTPYGIVVTKVTVDEPKEQMLSRKERQNLAPTFIKAIRRDLHDFYRQALEEDKEHWRTIRAREAKKKKERQERRAIILRNVNKKETEE